MDVYLVLLSRVIYVYSLCRWNTKCGQNLIHVLKYFLNKWRHCEDFPFWSVHGARCYCIFETILSYFCTLTGFTTPVHDYLINFHYVLRHIAAAHRRWLKPRQVHYVFLPMCVCAFVRSRPRWLYAVIKNCASRASAIICTRCVIDRSHLEVTPGVFDDDWATADIWGKMR